MKFFCLLLICSGTFLFNCSRKKRDKKDEQIRVDVSDTTATADSSLNSIQGNVDFKQIATSPNSVILTGLNAHRLITVYKNKTESQSSENFYSFRKYKSYEGEEEEYNDWEHFMPGLDILFGYNLINIAHYDFGTRKLNFLFDKPVLVKNLYYPSFNPDSLYKKPVFRNYYLVSVYDEDTNKDTLINRKDLRRIYHFNETAAVKTGLLPEDYSVIRSEYDPKNDVMYVFAKMDSNKNGTIDKKEPMHIFWVSLKSPVPATRMY